MTFQKYDITIIGGGIAGLYTAYQLLQKSPQKLKLLVLEKEGRLGGRIHTYEDESMRVEAGAGRIHRSHKLLLQLIDALQLQGKLQTIHSSPFYIDSTTGNRFSAHVGNQLIQKVIQAGKPPRMAQPEEKLRQMSFIDFAAQILSPFELQYMKNSFGFSTELYCMNAHDAITLMKTLISKQPFYFLAGGLQQIVESLTQRILSLGGHIKCHCRVANVTKASSTTYHIECATTATTYITEHCIFALPKECIQHFRFFQKLPYFQHIYCGSLCRIYTKFRGGGEWFEHLSRFTTQNDLRMVIPVNPAQGTMMISYSDNVYADRWNHYYKVHGMRKLKHRLRTLLAETLGIEVPPLGATRLFYWKCGVGYWKIGANSEAISRKIVKPFVGENLYICGEHYSSQHQQWVEGALETGDRVVKQLSFKN